VFVRAGVRIVHAAHDVYRFEVLPVAGAIASEHENGFSGVVPRSPEPIAFVLTDGLRKAVTRAEEV